MTPGGGLGRELLEHRSLEHWSEVWGFAYTLTADPSRSDDLCQEAYCRLLTMRRPVDTDRSLRPLLFTIVRNLVRSEARRPRCDSLDVAVEAGMALPADERSSDPERAATVDEENAVVREALAELDPVWSAVLYLRDGIGLSYAEIANVVDRTTDTVRVTLHRARARIRERLSQRIPQWRS